jgi:hypothetical protein
LSIWLRLLIQISQIFLALSSFHSSKACSCEQRVRCGLLNVSQ